MTKTEELRFNEAVIGERIVKTAKSGAYIIANLSRGERDMWADRTKLIAHNIYQKV